MTGGEFGLDWRPQKPVQSDSLYILSLSYIVFPRTLIASNIPTTLKHCLKYLVHRIL